MPSTLTAEQPVVRTLLSGAIDYAGMFPPASLSLEASWSNYLSYQASPDAWALGRLVLPARALRALPPLPHAPPPVPIAAIVGPQLEEDLDAIRTLSDRAGSARVETVEVKAGSLGTARMAIQACPPALRRYLEVPLGPESEPILDLLAEAGVHAKLRTGGTERGAFPAPAALARTIRALASRRLAFKATAGLHHPLRGDYRLTYAPDAPAGVMFGYLNLLLAALIAAEGGPTEALQAALTEADASAFTLASDALEWRGHSFPLEVIARVRAEFFHGFGSCSFREPLDEWPL